MDASSAPPQLPGVHLAWRDLSYSVKVKDGSTKTILSGLSGRVPPGSLLGIMGGSGGGKTSLLNCLTQRVQEWTGSIQINGRDIGPWSKRLQGLVSQDVPFFAHLTAYETLMFSARLKLPESVPKAERKAKVDSLLALMDLTHAAKTMVGDGILPGGLSGGERRRLALAVELLSDPALLFCDEVTSGLDSASALRILLILRRLARTTNKTIVITLHQPRADLLPLLDQILLLAKGHTIYFGPTFHGQGEDVSRSGDEDEDSTSSMLSYFRHAGYPLPPFACPTDVILDWLNGDHDDLLEDIAKEEGQVGQEGPEAQKPAVIVPRKPSVMDGNATEPTAKPAEAAGEAVVVVTLEEGPGSSSAPGPAGPASPKAPSTALLPKGPSKFSALAASKRVGGKSRMDTIADLAAKYAESPLAAKQLVVPASYPPLPKRAGRAENDTKERRYPTRWLTQVQVLLERTFLSKLRNPDATMSIFFGTIIVGIIVGSVFYKLPLSFSGARDRLSAISFLILTMSFACFDQVVTFPMERGIMLRENTAGSYSISAFYIGRSFAEIPVQLIFSSLVGIITWAMFGLTSGALGPYVLLIVLVTLCGASVLTFVGSLSNSLAQGNALATVFLIFSSLFNSFYISTANLPVVWRWIQHISFPAFGVQGAVAAELTGLTFPCTPDDVLAGCTGSGESILFTVGAVGVKWQRMALWLFIEILVFRFLTLLALNFCWTGQSFRQDIRRMLGK